MPTGSISLNCLTSAKNYVRIYMKQDKKKKKCINYPLYFELRVHSSASAIYI